MKTDNLFELSLKIEQKVTCRFKPVQAHGYQAYLYERFQGKINKSATSKKFGSKVILLCRPICLVNVDERNEDVDCVGRQVLPLTLMVSIRVPVLLDVDNLIL